MAITAVTHVRSSQDQYRAKAFQRGIRKRRSGGLRVHGRCRGKHGQDDYSIAAFVLLRRELEDIGIVVKTVALPSKGHAPTSEEISLLQSIDVRVAYEGRVTVVGVPIGNDEYVLERAREIGKEGGTDHLARCLPNKPDKQAAALIVTESLGQRTCYLERALDTDLS